MGACRQALVVECREVSCKLFHIRLPQKFLAIEANACKVIVSGDYSLAELSTGSFVERGYNGDIMKKFLKTLGALTAAFAIALSVAFAVSAWTEPTAQPPDGNIAAPINVGVFPQTKDGDLTITKLLNTKGLWIGSGGGLVSTTTYSLQNSLLFGVNGKTGAKQYCDENGLNCFSTADVHKLLAIPATGIAITPPALSLKVGATGQLTATISPSDATDQTITWTSSNNAIATVNENGLVSAKAVGSATITAKTANDKTATASVTVSAATISASGISLSPTTLNVKVGNTGTLTATVSPNDAANRTVSWSSSNTDTATVSNGTVACKAAGSATITAKTSDGSNKSATATVNCFDYMVSVITANAGGTFTPSIQYVRDNGTASFTATLDTDYEITSVVLKSGTVQDTTTGRVNATKTKITLKPTSDVVLEVKFSRFAHFAGLTWQNDQNLFLCYNSWAGRNYGYCSAGNGLLTATNQAGGSGAVEYCEFLNADGVTLSTTTRPRIWRLPTKSDFEAITDSTKSNPATQAAGFTANDLYWTQTLDVQDSSYPAYYWASTNGGFNIFLHGFGGGYSGFNYRYGTMRVRCVK